MCLLVCSKADAEVENNSATPPVASSSIAGESYREVRGIAAGSIDMREFVSESSSAYAGKSTTAVIATSRFLPEIRVDRSDDIGLENYSTSPRKYQEPVAIFDPTIATFSTRSNSRCLVNEPVNYSVNDCCSFRGGGGDSSGGGGSSGSGVGDLAKYHDGKIFLPVSNVSAECQPAKVLCNADVESRLGAMPDVTLAVNSDVELLASAELKNREHVVSSAMPDIANTSERKQPDGEEKKTPEIMVTGCDSATSGMLDRISHDLDYLLNRTHAKEGA